MVIANYGLENGFQMACIYAAILGAISAISIIVFLKETLQRKTVDRPPFSLRPVLFEYTRLSVGTLPSSLKILIFSYSLVAFANGMVARYYILFASDVIGLTALDWGLIVSFQFLLAIALKIPGGWLSDKFGKRKVMIISLLITAPTIVFFTWSQLFIQVLFALLLLVAAGIYFAPAYEALQADFTPKAMRGRITALWDISIAVSAALGALIGGFMFQLVSPASPFYFFAATEWAAALLLIKMVREPETKEA